jgi:WD40 repeat protein/serine/threonine protein kinase
MNERSIFMEALDFEEPRERSAYVKRACSDDEQLRARVEALLHRHQEDDKLSLDRMPLVDPSVTEDLAQPLEQPGTVIGPYKLMEQIGEGGMGTVYVAEQTHPVRRKVALKIIKPGMDTRQVIARFEAERQALAMMDHPNIAKVHDGGTTESGRPFFVMELVRGLPITDYCDWEQLSIRERLELFVLVCRAVQHAHQKGIIHRDLKPSNLLVTVIDCVAVPKVIDFGIAKATGGQLTERTLYTGFSQFVGTPRYMSPEQAAMSAADVDTRSDIYALGVLLYELLTGTTPLDQEMLGRAAWDEMRRLIREQEPPTPSTKLSALGEALPAVSANRKSDPGHLGRELRGELDWIVMKALEKDRRRRYETAAAFAADVMQHLSDRPVDACPPSKWYRFGKFARRHRAGLSTAAVVALALIAGMVISAWQAIRAEQARQAVAAVNETLRGTLYFNRISLADRELAVNNLRRVDQLLDSCPSDLRGWEWNYLRRARSGYEAIICRAPSPIYDVTFSPDDQRIASGHLNQTITIWEAATGKPIQVLRGHSNVRDVAFSPDGWRLASRTQHDGARIWELMTGRVIHTLRTHGGGWNVAFSPDGRWLATNNDPASTDAEAGQIAAFDGTAVDIWDATTGRLIRTIRDPVGATSLAISPDGTRIATGAEDGTVTVREAATGRTVHVLPGRAGFVREVAFSPDGRHLGAACGDATTEKPGAILIWDAMIGRLLHTLEGHIKPVIGVAFSADSKRLASTAFDHKVKIWDVGTGQEALTLHGHSDGLDGVAFSPDGWRLASAGQDRTIRIWDASPLTEPPAREILTLAGHTDDVRAVAFSPIGQRIASTGLDGTVRVWDAACGQLLRSIDGKGKHILSLAFSPDGQRIVSAGDGGKARIWDVANGALVHTLDSTADSTDDSPIMSVVFSADGRRLATGCMGCQVRLWDAGTGKPVLALPDQDWNVFGVAFRPDGRQLVTGCRDGTVKVWETETGRLVRTLKQGVGRISSVAFSPDDRLVATAGVDGAVRVWETATWAERRPIPAHDGPSLAVTFSPDGRRLASGGTDQTIKIWDPESGRELLTLRGHRGEVHSVAFSPDGRRLASAGGDRVVKVWDVMAGSEAGRDSRR